MASNKLNISTNKRWQPGLLSFLLHAGLLILASLWVFQQPASVGGGLPDRVGEIVLATATSDRQTVEYHAENEAPADSANSAADIPQLPDALTQPEIPPIERTHVEGAGPPLEMSESANQMQQSLSASRIEHTLSDHDLEAIAREQRALGNRQPQGPLVAASLFGSGKIEGRRFVFVIDRSASMGDSGLGVLFLARKELANAVAALTPENHFQVLVYNDKVTMIGERNMLAANEENRRRLTQFMGSIAAFGATNHEAGMYSALALRPDVIIWLADGGYPEMNANQIRSFLSTAGQRVAVHSFEFGTKPDPPAGSFMRKMAEDAGGTYRYVNVDEWKRQNQER